MNDKKYSEDSASVKLFGVVAERLLAWYGVNHRDLPWREEPTPYHVWLSEIMLQQTRVEAVKEYYRRFLAELPEIKDLASASEDEILKLWEGLGYYSRVRNMQKAACVVMQEYNGELPETKAELLSLPGIGDYTAGAISSIAYGQPEAAVDGNVLRVGTRILVDSRDIGQAKVKKDYEALIHEAYLQNPGIPAGIVNQAYMDLGATICAPNGAPHCEVCPLLDLCMAATCEEQEKYPVKAPKKKRRIEDKTVLIIRSGDRIALRKRPSSGLLAGLYEFPNVEGRLTESEALKEVESLGFVPLHIEEIPDAKHIFSHVEWHMKGYLIKVAEPEYEMPEAVLDEVVAYGNAVNGGEEVAYVDTNGETAEAVLFPERREVREKKAVPSAFAKYKKYI